MMNTKFASYLGDIFSLVYPVLMVLETFILVFGPISCAVELIICQLINSVSDAFDDWIELLRFNSDTHQADDTPNDKINSSKAVALNVLSSEM